MVSLVFFVLIDACHQVAAAGSQRHHLFFVLPVPAIACVVLARALCVKLVIIYMIFGKFVQSFFF